MAIIWQSVVENNHYEVRTAGESVRLYSNGVFHSQYNSKQKISNSVWDLLILPVFFYPPDKLRNILILGVGGGAAIKILHNFTNPEKIVGVELDPIHLKIARRFFKVRSEQASLICGDAVEWLNNYSGPPFDMIIDDLFGHHNGETIRAVPLSNRWIKCLGKNLSTRGLLVINTSERGEFNQNGFMANKWLTGAFTSIFKITHPTCENRVYIFSKKEVTLKTLKHNIANISQTAVRRSLSKLALRMRKIRVLSG